MSVRRELRAWLADHLVYWAFRLDPERFISGVKPDSGTMEWITAEAIENGMEGLPTLDRYDDRKAPSAR